MPPGHPWFVTCLFFKLSLCNPGWLGIQRSTWLYRIKGVWHHTQQHAAFWNTFMNSYLEMSTVLKTSWAQRWMRCLPRTQDVQTLLDDKKANNCYSARWVTSKRKSIGSQPHLGIPVLPVKGTFQSKISEKILLSPFPTQHIQMMLPTIPRLSISRTCKNRNSSTREENSWVSFQRKFHKTTPRKPDLNNSYCPPLPGPETGCRRIYLKRKKVDIKTHIIPRDQTSPQDSFRLSFSFVLPTRLNGNLIMNGGF